MNHPAVSPACVHWTEHGIERSAAWRSENGAAAPQRLLLADDTLKADAALRLMRSGHALLWRGDFHNARQLLQALGRRTAIKTSSPGPDSSPAARFHQLRMMQAQRARLLGLLLIAVEPGHIIALRRAPDMREACTAAYGEAADAYLVSLRELLGVGGAWEWRRKGVEIKALGQRIHAHYGVFSPVRGEYVDLVAQAPLPATTLAFDIGTGTGVLAAVLAQRGVQRVIATDQDQRALLCARENLQRLGFAEQVQTVCADLFPPGRAPLIVCNPPWIPARPSSALEYAVYDPDGRMLSGFLHGLGAHLEPNGEGWLILSDLAEHLQLRSRQALLDAIQGAGLRVVARLDTRPMHGRANDEADPLHMARSAEITSLWRLAHV